MTDNLPIIIAGVCAFLLIALILALIFSRQFRDAMLGGEGEATVIGLLTVKGVAIVLLCALFVGGLIYPLYLQSKTNLVDNTLRSLPICPEVKCSQQIASTISSLDAYSADIEPEQVIALTKKELQEAKASKASCSNTIDKEKEKNKLLSQDLSSKNDEIQKYKDENKGLLSKLDKINSDIQEFYPAVDFSWNIDARKKEAAYRILEVLRILGQYSGTPSNDSELAREALIRFQKTKQILPDKEKNQGLLGRSTFVKLIEEYMAYENTVANKAFSHGPIAVALVPHVTAMAR